MSMYSVSICICCSRSRFSTFPQMTPTCPRLYTSTLTWVQIALVPRATIKCQPTLEQCESLAKMVLFVIYADAPPLPLEESFGYVFRAVYVLDCVEISSCQSFLAHKSIERNEDTPPIITSDQSRSSISKSITPPHVQKNHAR